MQRRPVARSPSIFLRLGVDCEVVARNMGVYAVYSKYIQ